MSLVVSACRSSASRALERFEFSRYAMGGEARVALYAASRETAIDAAQAAFARIEALDETLSDWRDDNELARLVARAGLGPVRVSDDLYDCLETSLRFARETDGAFDPTVAPLVELWRAARRSGELPNSAAIDAARARVGWRNVVLDPIARTAELRAGTKLDFGAIGQGFACDRALEVLNERGIESALVEISGDFAVSGPPPGRRGWKIDVGTDASRAAIELAHAAITTSGDSEQHIDIDGVRYSHVVDPATGLGLTNGASASVIAHDATTADALATAACVLGVERGFALVSSFEGCAARIEERKGATLARRVSPCFETR